MNTLDPHTATTAIIAMGVGYVMLYAGVTKNALEWKRKRHVCPSCGRHDGCGCH